MIFGALNPIPPSQSPGQYYFKPMMKEFRFEPSAQMITVEEGQSLRIPIIGFKTAYRYVFMQVWTCTLGSESLAFWKIRFF